MQNSSYINAAEITSSTVPTSLELELMELIVNHRIALSETTLSFADIIGKLKIEFSPNLKEDIEQIKISDLGTELSHLQKSKTLIDIEIQQLHGKLDQLARQLEAKGIFPYHDAEFKKNHSHLEPLYCQRENIERLINEIIDKLNTGNNYINLRTSLLGEFIPGLNPCVVLYYNNIGTTKSHDRYAKLLGTFVHEMMHAWFYFKSKEQPRSIKVVDEPMVEFSTLFFLNQLFIETSKNSHKLNHHIEKTLNMRMSTVLNKQYSLGSTAAYGYGYFLYKNLGKDSKEWIEEYSRKSSMISIDNTDVQTFQTSFATCYPFNDENKLKGVLENIIFEHIKPLSTSTTSTITPALTHSKTKSDPICKWRIASIANVVELVSLLPKTKMSKEDFRLHMSACYKGAFFRTPYQLALQLGLYYEDEIEYIPRFDHNITEAEAAAYMHKWMERYYVPNPFTKQGFINIVPSINLLNGLANYIITNPSTPNLETAGAVLFGGEMGNIGNVKYVLNEYSNIIEVDSYNNMTLHRKSIGTIYVTNRREDKKAFFDHFN